jgi:peptide-methionine (S)-S-oxide reductase
MWRPKLLSIPTPEEALPGRSDPILSTDTHVVSGNPISGVCPAGLSELMVGMGCFWGAERAFWSLPGVYSTSVGYAAGHTPNPTYEEVCTGMTGHNEVVRIWFKPDEIGLQDLLKAFWEGHDPTQGMRQGNDVGTQYRSGIYLAQSDAETAELEASLKAYQACLNRQGQPEITTEIQTGITYFMAEAYHQQYLAKNPNGYCGLGGCGVKYSRGDLQSD